jgi:hypothetical protein
MKLKKKIKLKKFIQVKKLQLREYKLNLNEK